MSQRYYIAIPNNVKWTYQTIPTWKNYSFTGSLREAQEKTIELFKNNGNIDDDTILDSLSYYYDEKQYKIICNEWEDIDDDKKYEYCKIYYDDYLKFYIDDSNKGLALWDDVSNSDKKNIYAGELNVIEL